MKKLTLLIIAISYQLTAISYTAHAQMTDLLDFNGTNGSESWGSVIVSGNVLYGMTNDGGANDYGNIFSINTNGSGYKDLWDFDDTGSNGYYPGIALTLSGNTLYGGTQNGGINNEGNIFSIHTDGSNYKDLWDFYDTGSVGNANGENSESTLVLAGNKLYGMTISGGANNDGLIFSINTNGSAFKDLWDFDGGGDTNGTNPFGSLTLRGKKLYGMTANGGTYSDGNVFSIDTNGSSYKDLLDFNNGNGGDPQGSLTLSSSGKVLYGMTEEGGQGYEDGVIFSLDTDGTHFKELLQFNGTTGANPNGDLTLSGNLLYGMASEGGLYGYTGRKGNGGDGIMFSIDTDGKASTYTDLFDFNITDGSNPQTDLTLAGGTLYGMTPVGGANNDGVVFSYDLCPLLTSKQYSQASDTGGCFGIAAVTPSGGPTPYIYLWSGGQTTDTISGQCPGTYTYTITDNNGCKIINSVTIGSITGINNISSNSTQINIYPNPGSGQFTFEWAVGSGQSTVVQVYNILGEQVYSNSFTTHNSRPNGSSGRAQFTINLSSQPNGIYLYRVITQQGNLVGQGKLVIQK